MTDAPTLADLVDAPDEPAQPERRPLSFSASTAVYILSGPVGPSLDLFVTTAVLLTLNVEPIEAGRYRIAGAIKLARPFADWVEQSNAPYGCVLEAPAGVMFTVGAAQPPRPVRKIEIRGDSHVHAYVRLAVDHRLTVSPGLDVWRFNVAGRTSALVAWMAEALKVDRAEAMARMGLDELTVEREDREADQPVHVRVEMPVRQAVSEIERDRFNEITRVTRTERSV